MTRAAIIAHCAWMAERDREYAEWAWRWYVREMPWIEGNPQLREPGKAGES